ncbi:MAG: GNAT family N-acetyltransferase [Paracoccaceae bacterium]
MANLTSHLVPPEAIEELRQNWTALADTHPEATVFDHPDFVIPLMAAFPHAVRGVLALHDGDGALCGVMALADLPLAIGPLSVREAGFISNAHTLRHNPLLPADGSADQAFLRAVATHCTGRDTLRLSNLPDQLAYRLYDAADAIGHATDPVEDGRMLFTVDLHKGADAWLTGLSSSNRYKIRKAVKRTTQAGEVSFSILKGHQIRDALPVWQGIVANSWQGQEGDEGANGPSDWALHEGLLNNGFLAFLSIDGTPVASHRWLQHRQTIYSHVQHYDLSYKSAEPGYALIAHVLEQGDAFGFDRADLNGSTRQYKVLHDGVLPHKTLRIYLKGARPRAVQVLRRWRKAAQARFTPPAANGSPPAP